MELIGDDYILLQQERDTNRENLKRFLKENKQELRKEANTTGDKPLAQIHNELQEKVYNSALTCSNYLQNIQNMSKFDSSIISYIAELMSIYEGEEYIPKVVMGPKEKQQHFGIVREVRKRTMAIGPSYDATSKNLSNSLVLTREIVKADEEVGAKDIWFYLAIDDSLVSTVDFSLFPYVKDFIDLLITCRLGKENKAALREDEYKAILKRFVELRVEKIELYQKMKSGPALYSVDDLIPKI